MRTLTKAHLHAGIIWRDVLLMDDVLNEAALPDYSLEVSLLVLFQFIFIISLKFSFTLRNRSRFYFLVTVEGRFLSIQINLCSSGCSGYCETIC